MNLPFDLIDINNILIIGIGGGFDIYAGLPLYFKLKDNYNITFANYSLAKMSDPKLHAEKITKNTRTDYFPEGWLADFTKKEVWQINKLGVIPVKKAIQEIVKINEIDLIIMVDGGVDSIMHGDESNPGTILEDTVSLAAIKDFDLQSYGHIKTILACIGMGTEIEEGLSTESALKNIAELIKDNAFYGTCSLNPNWEAFRYYKEAYEFARNQPGFRESHISSRIIPAVEGTYTNQLNPLMGIYWFFEGYSVIQKNMLVPLIEKTITFTDVNIIYRQFKS